MRISKNGLWVLVVATAETSVARKARAFGYADLSGAVGLNLKSWLMSLRMMLASHPQDTRVMSEI